MRIRIFPFKDDILTEGIRSLVYDGFNGGEVIWIQDETALKYIKEKLAEKFDYSIPDNDIRKLHDDFMNASDFNKKVEIFMETLSNSVNKAIFEDGTEARFTIAPETAYEWFHYNSELIDFYKNKFPEITADGLIKSFVNKCRNSPDHQKVIDSELKRINKILTDSRFIGITYWYNEKCIGNVPKDEEAYKLFLSSSIPHGVEDFIKGDAFAEYESYLKSKNFDEIVCKDAHKEVITIFPQLFTSQIKYQSIMSILIKENLCQEGTLIWIDSKKGNKSVLASLIKHLHSKGYYSKYPTNDEVLLIAKNSFKCDIGIDTVKRARIDSYSFEFIPDSI